MTTKCFMSVPYLVPAGFIPALGSLLSPTALTSVALISHQAMFGPSEPARISTMAHLPMTPLPSSLVPWQCAQTALPSSLSSQPISLNQIIALSDPSIMPWAQAQSVGMILSPALQPIPIRLVKWIMSGEFVEMCELLSDNLALHDQLEAVHGPLVPATTPGSLRARMRGCCH